MAREKTLAEQVKRGEIDATAIRERSLRDPVWWMREVLGAKPWPVQGDIAESVRDNVRTAVKSCHSAGKSYISARIALWWLFCNPGSIVLTTAPTGRQVKHVLWREIRKAHGSSKLPLGGVLPPVEPRLTIRGDWFMLGFSTDDSDKFQGWHATKLLVIIDEAPGIPDQIWEGIEGVMASGDVRLLAIGNPVSPSGPFWEMCKPGSGAKRTGISAYDTPNFTTFGITEADIASGNWKKKIGKAKLPLPTLIGPEWVADRYQRWGPDSPMYVSRILGDFPKSATDALIPLDWVEAAQNRTLEPIGDTVLAVDVARFGEDESVACQRTGMVARIVDSWGQTDTMQTVGKVMQIQAEVKAKTVAVDSIGVGGGVVDRLAELGINTIDLNVGMASSEPDRFLNKRAEYFWYLRERFEAGHIDIDPDDEELAGELTNIKYEYTSRGQIKIESKEDMKKRGVGSPDRADSLMLAFATADRTGDFLLPGRRMIGIGKKFRSFEEFPGVPGDVKPGKFY